MESPAPKSLQLPERLELSPSSRGFRLLLSAMTLAVFVVYTYINWTQFRAGLIQGDAAERFNYMLSLNLAGEWFANPHTNNSFLSTHVMLWLIPATLLYLVHDGLMTFVVLMAGALAVAIVPLGLFARRATGSETFAVALCVLYACNTLTGSLLLSVHAENLYLPLWFLLFWAVEANRARWVWVAAAGMMLVKEDAPVWLLVYVAWAWFFGRMETRMAAWLAGFCVVCKVAFGLFIKLLPAEADFDTGMFWIDRYQGLGDTPGELAMYLLTHPWYPLTALATPVWLPVILAGGGLCLLGWRAMLLTLPPAVFFFTSTSWEPFSKLLYYYSYPLIPPVFLAACEGARFVITRWPGARTEWIVASFVALVGAGQLLMPTRAEGRYLRPFPESPRATLAREFVRAAVPGRDAEMRVATQQTLAPFLPRGRNFVALQERHLDGADRVLLDLRMRAWDHTQESYQALLDRLSDPEGEWRLETELEGLVLFVRR